MLQLILGRSGFGKTHEATERIVAAAHAQTGGASVLIVPEQASFETERALVRRLGDADVAKVQVLSFTRMIETLMKEHAGRPLSNGAKIMLMSRAVAECADRLTLYADAKRADTVSALLDAATDCHQAAVTPSALSEAADKLPEGALRQKTAEISLLLETYHTLKADCGYDPQESLSVFAAFLEETRPLQGATVVVDGFRSFTAPELQVLSALMAQAASVTVTLCTDRVHDDTDGLDRFSVVMQTARRLMRAAEERGCAVEKPQLLMTPHRFRNDTLEALEATVFTPEQWEVEPSEAVRLTVCSDIYEECSFVAQTIRRLMRTEGRRAREFAVVARDLTSYVGVLDAAFDAAEIPYYLDRRAPIAGEGLIAAVTAAVKIAVGDWRTESLLRLMKTGLLGFSASSAATLENYVYVWNITGAQFKNEWQAHPRGFVPTLTARDEGQLERLNRLRRRLVRPLVTLAKSLSSPLNGEEFATAVYKYVRAARIDRMIAGRIRRLRKTDPSLAEHTEQVWNAFVSILDDMATVLGEDRLDAAHLLELFRSATVKTDVGTIPQLLDAVQIGAADRMRFAAPSIVFVLGANEGVFPSLPSGGGLFSDRDRRMLGEVGVQFEDDREEHTATERFLAYTALSAASEQVYVSTLLQTPDGERGERSSIWQTVTAHLPFVTERAAVADDGSDIETVGAAFERMADGFCAGTPLSRALYRLLWEDESLRGRLSAMTRMREETPVTFASEAEAARFFGDRMVLSPSRVERYHQCRFAYFCQYGLRALPRRTAELGALEFGTLTHYVMEHTLPQYIAEGIDTIRKARCFEDAKATSMRFVDDEMGGLEDKPPRFTYLLIRLQGVCGNFLWQAVRELSQSRFVPTDYELSIGYGDDNVEPMTFTLPDGAQVAMIGQIDRVDVYDQGTTRYVRVIDYKTGSKQFRLEDVVEGINLQMLIYMMTLWKNGGKRYGEVLPAGLLYMPSKTPMVKAEEAPTEAAREQQQMKQMRMNGLLLDDEQVLRAMEPGVQGVFIPAKLKKDGSLSKTSSVATLAQFGALGRRAQKLLTDMAKTLRAGDVDTCPFVTSSNDPCRYCDYRAVCGHESDDRVREPSCSSTEEVLASLTETEE
ncbi:MAG: PD-(D/E)XK nuclease family protein [Clostridia bacterium]|nr:PD-(D/E)XK nuclease family protein [Clostridia bacterium]